MVTKVSKDKKPEFDSKLGGAKTNPSLLSTTSAKPNGINEENKETTKESKPILKETSKETSEIGVSKWEEIRGKWTKKTGDKKAFSIAKPTTETGRNIIADIIRSTKAPYDKFPHPVSLAELVDICVEVWEGDSDDD